jgi:3-hydroxyisobutyrate dehydrogenase-like beta-hydroxyacid dehydrogenase
MQESEKAQVAFIGLGVMGSPMARHLTTAGHDVTVFNRTGAKADAWVGANGGRSASTPKAAAEGAAFVFVCVGNDSDLRDVVLGEDGALAGMSAGSVLVDHTTASADVAREIAAAATARGVGFIDAPVSGGQAGAENGVLTVMCGCDDEATFMAARNVIMSYAKACELMGAVGAGQLTKMVNQICIAGVVQGLAEGINFALRAGLDVDKVVATIGKGAAQSWQMDNRAATMARDEYDFGFAVEWMRKDLGICMDEAARNGASLPVIEIIDGYYAQVVARGGKRWDTSSLMHLLTHPHAP